MATKKKFAPENLAKRLLTILQKKEELFDYLPPIFSKPKKPKKLAVIEAKIPFTGGFCILSLRVTLKKVNNDWEEYWFSYQFNHGNTYVSFLEESELEALPYHIRVEKPDPDNQSDKDKSAPHKHTHMHVTNNISIPRFDVSSTDLAGSSSQDALLFFLSLIEKEFALKDSKGKTYFEEYLSSYN